MYCGMKRDILIPLESEYCIVSQNNSSYCFDVATSSILKIDEDIKNILQDYKGCSIRTIIDNFANHEYLIKNIISIKGQGVFNPIRKKLEIKANGIGRVTIGLTEDCNYYCSYCYAHHDILGKENINISRDIIDNIINCLYDYEGDYVEVSFFGGEPLLCFDLIQYFVSKAKKSDKKFKYGITTNASLIDEEMAIFMRDNDFRVIVSLDFPKNACDLYRNSRGGSSYDLTVKGIKILNRYYDKGCVVNAVITRDNLNIEKIIDSFLEENISNKLSITIATDQHPLNEEEMGIVIDGEQAVINNILHGKYRSSFIYMPLSRVIASLIKRIHKLNRCYAGVDMVAVDVSGKIYPCHRFISISEFVIGDIAQGVFCDTYSSYCMNSVDLNDACIHCWARYLCGGPCMHDSYVCHCDTMAVSEYRCNRIKSLIESAIIIYGELIEKNKKALIDMVNL